MIYIRNLLSEDQGPRRRLISFSGTGSGGRIDIVVLEPFFWGVSCILRLTFEIAEEI